MVGMKSTETAKTMIHDCFPDFAIKHIELAGEGMDSRSFFVNETYVFRFPKRPKVAEDLKIEIKLLPKLQKGVSLPIPQFEFIGNRKDDLLFVGYKKIEGATLSEVWSSAASDVREKILHSLGIFLKEIHSFPLEEAKKCDVPLHSSRRVYKGDFLKLAEDIKPILSDTVSGFIENLYKEYLSDDRNLSYEPVFLHADFGAGHIFCDPKDKRVTGIIDFGDIGIGDPDYDLMYLYGEFGWDFILQFLRHYQRSDNDLEVLHQKLRLLLVHNTMDDIWMGRDRKEKELEEFASELLAKRVEKMRQGIFY